MVGTRQLLGERMNLPSQIDLVIVTPGNLKRLWEKMSQFDQIWADGHPEAEDFVKDVMSRDNAYFELPEHGVLYLTEIFPGRSACGHFCFWDRRLRGKEEIVKEMVEWSFDTFNLERLQVSLPDFAKATMRFVERIGMQKEGILRKAHHYKGEFLNLHIYSFLRGEVNGQ